MFVRGTGVKHALQHWNKTVLGNIFEKGRELLHQLNVLHVKKGIAG